MWAIGRTLASAVSKVGAMESPEQRRDATWLRCSQAPLATVRGADHGGGKGRNWGLGRK